MGRAERWKEPDRLPQAVYVRSDIASVEGKEYMKAYQLRSPAKSTRVHCIECFSILGINHPVYSDNVFMFFPNHCDADLDLSIKPCASINMSSYLYSEIADIPEDVPVFHNFDYPQEYERFFSISDVMSTFRKPSSTPKGRTFSDLLSDLGEIKVLDLQIDAEPTA